MGSVSDKPPVADYATPGTVHQRLRLRRLLKLLMLPAFVACAWGAAWFVRAGFGGGEVEEVSRALWLFVAGFGGMVVIRAALWWLER